MAGSGKRARWSDATFLLAFGTTLFVLAWMSLTFLVPLVLALSTAVLLWRPYEWVAARLGGRRRITALLMSVAAFVIILAPLVLIIIRLVQELVPLMSQFAESFGTGRISAFLTERIPESLQQTVDIGELQEEFRQNLSEFATGLAAFAATLPAFAANLSIDAFVAFIALYVYFVRGKKLVDAIVEATPMERRYTRKLLETMGAAIRTVFAASFITAVIQFGLGWAAFAIVGTPYALPLAAMMAFFSFVFALVPVLGSGLVWGPVGVGLIIGGRPAAGIFVLAWGLLVLGSVDNIIKPLYAKGALQLSPLLVFVTLFGGIAVIGPIGALLGPLVAALAAAFLRIWTTEFLEDAEPLPRAPITTGRPGPPWFLKRMRRREA
jgi:predicted PurR-regulated permease PerM